MPVGMENRKLQDSAFSATKFHSSNPPKEARLNTGKSWCPPKGPGNKEYLQVDIQKVILIIQCVLAKGDPFYVISLILTKLHTPNEI